MASSTDENAPPTTASVLNSFKNFHRLYFRKLQFMGDIKTLVYMIGDSEDKLALSDLLKPPPDAAQDAVSFDELRRLLNEFVFHVCEGMISLISEKWGTDPVLGPQLPESNLEQSVCPTLSDVFRNDIEGVGLLIYNLALALSHEDQNLFTQESILSLTETVLAIEKVQQVHPEFWEVPVAELNFPPVPVNLVIDNSLEEANSAEVAVEPEPEPEPVPQPHAEFLNQLYKAFDAVEVLDGSVDVKALKDQIPADLVVTGPLWERCIRVIKVLTPTETEDPQTNAVVDLLHALFIRVPDYNEALTAYWQSCHEANGPLAYSRFNVRSGLRHFERCMGNHNQTTEDEIKPMIQLFAWLLIGDTRDTLTSILKGLIHNEQLVHFFRKTVRYLPIVYTYQTASGFNVILLAMADIVADLYVRNDNTTIDQASRLLTKLSQNFNDNTPGLIPPTPLLDFAVKQSFSSEGPTFFWLRVASKLVDGTASGRRSIVIDWDVTSKLPHNPFILAVFMVKISAIKKSAEIGVAVKNIMQALANILDNTPALLSGWQALDTIDDVHWAFKFAVLQWLRVPDIHYKPQVPSVMYHVLKEEEKARFRELRYGNLSLGDFLVSVFEIGFLGGDIPDIFLNGAVTKFARSENNDVLSIALLTALKNVRKLGVETFEPGMFDFINKVAKVLNYEVYAPLVGSWTPVTFKTLSNLQSIRFVGLAFRIAVEKHLHVRSLGEEKEKVKLDDLDAEAKLLFTTYCTASYQRITKLREVFRETNFYKNEKNGSAADCLAAESYLNAVNALYFDCVPLTMQLEPIPDELKSLVQEFRSARNLAAGKIFSAVNAVIPNPNPHRKNKKKEAESKQDGVDEKNGEENDSEPKQSAIGENKPEEKDSKSKQNGGFERKRGPRDFKPKKDGFGEKKDEEKESQPQQNGGGGDAADTSTNAIVQSDIEMTDAATTTGEPSSSNEAEIKSSNGPGKRSFRRNHNYRGNSNFTGSGGRKYHNGYNNRDRPGNDRNGQ